MGLAILRRTMLASVLLSLCLAGPYPVPAQQAPAQQTAFNPALPLIHTDYGPNSAKAESQHYVVLVSLDGFRWDYAKRDNATHLLALAKQGVWAPEGMLPSYPSLTFPNHYTIVTGLYPEHNGLVANSFFDPVRHASYSYTVPADTGDGSWYSGTPLWSLAESQGMRTASFMWVASNAEIAGFRPSWYAQYDSTENTANEQQARIDNAVALLRLPASERPHFISIYYSEPDHTGHQFGPDAPQTRAAALKMDEQVGKLKAALDATGLPVDLVVVSDHGMVKDEGGWITLAQFADLSGFDTVGQLLYGKTEEDRVRVYNQLKKASSSFVVYRLKDVPANLHYNQNSRAGDPVVIATGPYDIRDHAPEAGKPLTTGIHGLDPDDMRAHGPEAGKTDKPPTIGIHGLDPTKVPEMKAIFFAAGPDIVAGKTVAPFENVNLYPWLAHLLGLTAPKTDGNLNLLSGTLRDSGGEVVQEESREGATSK